MSDSESDCDENYEIMDYSLILFVHKGRKRKIESVDIVPSKWISFDQKKGRVVSKYMAPPYNDEDLHLLNDLIKSNANAPESWPVYSIVFKGRARNYEEALTKIKELENGEDHVLTLESEDDESVVQKNFENSIKKRQLLSAAEEMKKQLATKEDSLLEAKVKLANSKSKVLHEVTNTLKKRSAKVSASTSVGNNQGNNVIKTMNLANKPTPAHTVVSNEAIIEHKNSGISAFIPPTYINDDVTGLLTSTNSDATVTPEHFLQNQDNIEVVTEVTSPIINLENVECKSEFETAVVAFLMQMDSKIDRSSSDVNTLKEKVNEMSSFLIDKKIINKAGSEIEQKYNLSLPMNALENFTALENNLKENNFFRNDVYQQLCTLMDKDLVISRSMVNILKKFLSKELALKFCAIRKGTDKTKTVFKPTQLCQLIDASITNSRKKKSLSTDPQELSNSLSDVFSNVKRWSSQDLTI